MKDYWVTQKEIKETELDKLCTRRASLERQISKNSNIISMLENELMKAKDSQKIAKKNLKNVESNIDEYEQNISILTNKIKDNELMIDVSLIYARTPIEYLTKFFELKNILTVDEIMKMFLFADRKKQHKTIYKLLDNLLSRKIIKKIDAKRYKLVDKPSKHTYN